MSTYITTSLLSGYDDYKRYDEYPYYDEHTVWVWRVQTLWWVHTLLVNESAFANSLVYNWLFINSLDNKETLQQADEGDKWRKKAATGEKWKETTQGGDAVHPFVDGAMKISFQHREA